MKKEVILPDIPQNEEFQKFFFETIEEVKNLRTEVYDAIYSNIKHISEDYTINANDPYTEYHVDNSSAAVEVTFCPLASVKFKIVALDDSYNVTCTPVGTTVNGYATAPLINQKFGWWEFAGNMNQEIWIGTTNGCSTVYEVSTETADTGLSVDGTWDDVSGMTLLNGVYGKGNLSAFANQRVYDTGIVEVVYAEWGIGKTSGNNAPDIKYNDPVGVRTDGTDVLYGIYAERNICNFEYESDGSLIYMKSKAYSEELSVTTHQCRGTTNNPMYIKWYRTA